jgi:hypothetical protein
MTMSFVITIYVREGIVMASDSRLTLNSQNTQGQNQIVHLAVGQSDSNNKTFLSPSRIGISTYCAADIGGTPIGGYIESFINDVLETQNLTVDAVPKELLNYFGSMTPVPATQFHVAGYKDTNGSKEQQVWQVDVAQQRCQQLNPPNQQGASWGGEADILTRLIKPVATLDQNGKIEQTLPHYNIPWQFLTLQDAIDFTIFAMRSTIDAIRFLPRPKSVGGPIDVLVIKPNEASWIQRKLLRGETEI